MDLDRRLSISEKRQLFQLLTTYFSKQQFKSTLLSLKLKEDWIPLEQLVKIDKISKITRNPEDIIGLLHELECHWFQLHENKLSRTCEFDAKEYKHFYKLVYGVSVVGFETTSVMQVQAFFNQPVKQVPSWDNRFAFAYELETTQEQMLQMMALPPTYEDQKLFVKPKIHGSDDPVGQLLEFTLQSPLENPNQIKYQMEQFCQVDQIRYQPNALFGIIKLKAPVGKQVLKSLEHQGGLFVDDVQVQVNLLNAHEEQSWLQMTKPIQQSISPKQDKKKKPNKHQKKSLGISKKKKSKKLDLLSALQNL